MWSDKEFDNLRRRRQEHHRWEEREQIEQQELRVDWSSWCGLRKRQQHEPCSYIHCSCWCHDA
jgi:hypothetical protein